jgi:hypothetical protein
VDKEIFLAELVAYPFVLKVSLETMCNSQPVGCPSVPRIPRLAR